MKKVKLFDTPFEALLYIHKRCRFQIRFNIRIMFENNTGVAILNINEDIYIPYQIYHFMREYGYTINSIVWIDFLRYDGKQQLVYVKEVS